MAMIGRSFRGMRAPSACLLGALALLLVPRGVDAQGLTYTKGQTISPAYEGWQQNPDGSYNLVFGYMNRNWEEEIDIPVGPDNEFSPGSVDRGQPTRFLPSRNRNTFSIRVPADFDDDEELVWTLNIRGETNRAHASLAPDYFIDNIVVMSENGSISAGFTDARLRGNTPPVAELEGETERRVRVGEPVTLVMKASDDGIPTGGGTLFPTTNILTDDGELNLALALRLQPMLVVPGKANGLHVSWFVYRGPGQVTFNPLQIQVWEDTRPYSNSPWSLGWANPKPPEDGRWVAEATFDEPGTYILRGLVDDGGLSVYHDVTVEVIPLTL
tara:strand:+ start:538 stop:1521 length:984 start_codon:yes stop_codon:yes gene_type:complete